MSNFYLCNSAALEANLPKSAFKVYSFLSMGANNKTRSYFHSRATIAQQCGISVSTVIRAIKELCTAGLLEVERRFRKHGKQTTNLYTLLDNTQLHIRPSEPPMDNKNLPELVCNDTEKRLLQPLRTSYGLLSVILLPFKLNYLQMNLKFILISLSAQKKRASVCHQ